MPDLPTSTESGKCQFCGAEIDFMCDVCERHAMSHEQLAELAGRVKAAMWDYYLEIWPELQKRADA